jgi:hypothetical protein
LSGRDNRSHLHWSPEIAGRSKAAQIFLTVGDRHDFAGDTPAISDRRPGRNPL